MKKRLLITGAGGFLGSRLTGYFTDKPEYETVGVTRRELDIGDSLAVKAFFKAIRPDYVLHCAAVSDTGVCEREPERSRRINVEGTVNVARACQNSGGKMIFMSSDQIYNASDTLEPNKEGDEHRPSNVYGRDKKRSEEAILSCLPDAVALRLTWMYDYPSGKWGKCSGLLQNILTALEEKRTLRLPIHDYRGITCVWEVVRHMEEAMKLPGGIYNFGSENENNTYDTAALFLKTATGKDDEAGILEPDEKRFQSCPRNLTVNTDKIKSHGIYFLNTRDGILQCCREYGKGE